MKKIARLKLANSIMDGAKVEIVRVSKVSGRLTVKFVEQAGAYHVGDTIVVDAYEVKQDNK